MHSSWETFHRGNLSAPGKVSPNFLPVSPSFSQGGARAQFNYLGVWRGLCSHIDFFPLWGPEKEGVM